MPGSEDFRTNNDWTTNLFSGILERSESLTNDVLFATFVLGPQGVSARIAQSDSRNSSGFIPAERHTNGKSTFPEIEKIRLCARATSNRKPPT